MYWKLELATFMHWKRSIVLKEFALILYMLKTAGTSSKNFYRGIAFHQRIRISAFQIKVKEKQNKLIRSGSLRGKKLERMVSSGRIFALADDRIAEEHKDMEIDIDEETGEPFRRALPAPEGFGGIIC
jgi:hypothetical protein